MKTGRLALPLLLLAVSARTGDDRPDRRADPDLQPRVNAAIASGIDYLKSIQQPDGSWPYAMFPGTEDATAGMTALALYALSASKEGEAQEVRPAARHGWSAVVAA